MSQCETSTRKTRPTRRHLWRAVEAGPERVIKEVMRQYKIAWEEIFRGTRGQENEARKVAMYLVRRCCDCTLPEVVEHFGIGDYSTVSWSYSGIATRIAKEKKLRDRIEQIIASIS